MILLRFGLVSALVACSRPKSLDMKCSVGTGLVFDANDVFCGGMDGIHRTAKKGGADTLIVSGGKTPATIILDGDRVYFMPAEIATGEAIVRFVAKSGGAPADVMKLETPEQERPVHFAVDASAVYVTTLGRGSFGDERIDTASADYRGGVLLSAPKNGGPITILATGLHSPSGIVLDDAAVYWSEHGTYASSYDYKNDGAIKSVAKSGGAPKTLASAVDFPSGLARSGETLTFTTGGHFVNTGGTWTKVEGPMSIPKAGGAVTPADCVLSDSQHCFGVRTEDLGMSLYGMKTRKYLERWKTGGPHETIYKTDRDVSRLALEGDSLWWLEGTDYQLKRLQK